MAYELVTEKKKPHIEPTLMNFNYCIDTISPKTGKIARDNLPGVHQSIGAKTECT